MKSRVAILLLAVLKINVKRQISIYWVPIISGAENIDMSKQRIEEKNRRDKI